MFDCIENAEITCHRDYRKLQFLIVQAGKNRRKIALRIVFLARSVATNVACSRYIPQIFPAKLL